MPQYNAPFDTALQLKDAGAITADAGTTVASVAAIIDLGPNSRMVGCVFADVSAIKVSATDESYLLKAQVSSSSTFASAVNTVASMVLGAAAATGNTAASTTGRYELRVTNELNGTVYRYFRLFTDVGGTSPSINYVAWLTKGS